jgi:23S rRNA pseudouridine1911/1915/1917 synthase
MTLADSMNLLFEDNHCIAVNKPAGWPSAHFDGEEETVDRLVKDYLREKYGKPGNVFLGVVHRLDKPVSGVLLFARTSKAAARLSEQFRENAIEKIYWAVVEANVRKPLDPAGTLEDWLRKDTTTGVVEVTPPQAPDSRQALLHYSRLAEEAGLSLVEVRPQTGRTHQIRVQFASRGFPVYADTKYGSAHAFGPAIGLHARSLTFLHPIRKEPITLVAPLPKYWLGRFAYLLRDVPR